MACDHLLSRLTFRQAVGLRQVGIDDHPVAVLHQRMAQEGELGLLACALAMQLCLRIGRRDMRRIAALLAMEAAFAIAALVGLPIRLILGPEALHRRPGLNLRSVHREVLIRQKLAHPLVTEQLRQELARNVGLQQPVAVLLSANSGMEPAICRSAQEASTHFKGAMYGKAMPIEALSSFCTRSPQKHATSEDR